MGTFSMQEADNYGNSVNSGSFFTLRDDGDTAKVRFLYRTIDDVQGYAVHQVKVGEDSNGRDKYRYVNCLRNYNDPIDNCPLCKAQYKILPKMFIKLYNEDTQECQIWERGKTYFQRVANLAAHYNPLCNAVIEIQRHGKKGDLKTSYDFWPGETSEVNLEDYDCPEPLGTIILDKSVSEMEEFLTTGHFATDNETATENKGSSEPPRRTPSSSTPPRRAF